MSGDLSGNLSGDLSGNLSGDLFFPLAVAEVHAGEDEEGAEEEPGGDGFAEEPPGKKDGGDWIEIYPVGGYNGA